MSRRKGSLNKSSLMKRDSIQVWVDAFTITQKNKANYKRRLAELQTWDDCNGHETDRQNKIKALEILLNQ